MRILLSNDDGIHAPGIILMANRLAGLGHAVTAVAPDRERSGAGHSVTTTSLHMIKKNFPEYDERVAAFQCSGTPGDSAALGAEIAAKDAELLITGINRGSNMAYDVYYSGTVGSAREGYFEDLPAIAVSLCVDEGEHRAEDHFETAVFVVEHLIANIDAIFGEKRAPALLNVNVPNLPVAELKGYKTVFAGRRRYRNRVRVCEYPRGGVSYWRVPAVREKEEGSDIQAVTDGYAALTFLRHDPTDYDLNARLDKQVKENFSKLFRA